MDPFNGVYSATYSNVRSLRQFRSLHLLIDLGSCLRICGEWQPGYATAVR